jgi:hypothetical protein
MKSLPSGDRGRLVSPMGGARAKGLASTFLEHDRVGYERQDTQDLINNRQAGRRRGRGGQQQRPQGNSGRQDNGNRIDNRARGNAAQLLEKYKTLARDAQMQGDRVNTEYYLQFADHYFRVLAETRSRFEENRRQNGGAAYEEDEQEYDEDGEPIVREQNVRDPRQGNGNGQDRDRDRGQDRGNEGQNGNQAGQYDDERPRSRTGNADRSDRTERNGNGNGYSDSGNGRYTREDRGERTERNGNDRGDRGNRGEDRGNRAAPVADEEVRQEAPVQEAAPVAEVVAERPRRGRPPRRPVEEEAPAMFEANLLPPSLTVSAVTTEEEPVEKPKRRRGRPPASETTTAG